MEEFLNIVRAHIARYPGMEPQDLVKLVYQGEFGPAHLICHPEQALAYLEKEYETNEKRGNSLLWEDIGDGLGRIYLAGLPKEKMPALCRAFVNSARMREGSMARFLEKLALLEREDLPFPTEELTVFLDEYRERGCPMLSHSPAYRELYRPSYRVVERICAEEEGLL